MDNARSASIATRIRASELFLPFYARFARSAPLELIDNGIHNGNPLSVNCE